MLSMTPDEVERARGQLAGARKLERFRPFTVKVDIAREELDRFLAHQMDLPGVDVQPIPHRNYRYGGLGGHLIGYMNEAGPDELKRLNEEVQSSETGQGPYLLGDYIGRRGLERRFERQLRGIDGKERVPVDAKGRRKEDADDLIPEDQRVVPSVPGHNLVLSIDWRLQEFAEQAFPATAGVVLAMDAKTGFLLALVDRPAPDPNKMSGRITAAELAAIHSDPLQPELFRAIQQHYHPGSTFKALTSIAALEEGIYQPGTTVYCPGYFPDGLAPLALRQGLRPRVRGLRARARGELRRLLLRGRARGSAPTPSRSGPASSGSACRPGSASPGEVPGVMPDVAWHDRAPPRRLPARHGGEPRHRPGRRERDADAAARLLRRARDRDVWRPQVVLRVEDADGKVLQEFAPQERSRPKLKKSTRDTVMKGLLAAVNQPFGTAYWQRSKDFTIAGKTGTAQVVKMGKRMRAEQVPYFERDHAWFAAFAPAEDPEIVVVVLNEHSGFGSTNAAPTAMALIKKWMELKAQDAAERSGVAQAQDVAAPPGAAQIVPAPLATPGSAAAAPAAAKPAPVAAKPAPAAAKPAPVAAKPAPAAAKPAPVAAKPAPAAAKPAPVEAKPAPAQPRPTSAGVEAASPPVSVPKAVPAPPAAPPAPQLGEKQGGNDGGA